MAATRLRYDAVRVADLTDDQQTAAAILAALTTSVTQEDLQEGILSQIKRLIHGSAIGNWNSDFIAEGILPLGQLTTLVTNQLSTATATCLSTDVVGALVYVTGPTVGGVPQVTTVDPTDKTKMPAIGMIASKSSPTDCVMTMIGLVPMIGLTPNARYMVDVTGLITPVVPAARPVLIQYVGQALDEGHLMLKPSLDMVRLIP